MAGYTVVMDIERLAQAIHEERLANDMSLADLAKAAVTSQSYIWRLERGDSKRPGAAVLDRIAHALGFATVHDLLADHKPRVLKSSAVGTLEDVQAPGARTIPVYRWGFAGDPFDPDQAPIEDHLAHPPPGKESLLPPGTIGVLVRGDTMSGFGLHHGDTAWVVPRRLRHPQFERAVLAHVWRDGEKPSHVLKLYRQKVGEEHLFNVHVSKGISEFKYRRFQVVGVVVWVTAPGRAPEFQPKEQTAE
ncbi:MAG: hypothetical protein CL878_03615 [Dehalococcoidia bacterium]|nr:hypothetical protein [Dehalococcoidia bacterium]